MKHDHNVFSNLHSFLDSSRFRRLWHNRPRHHQRSPLNLNSNKFSRVIGLTNRPLSSARARLPEDERLELYSEINLLDREKSLLQLQHVPKIQEVTHVYYAAYAGHGSSFEELKRINNELLTNAIGGIEICCPALQFVTLNTGGKVSNTTSSPSWEEPTEATDH